MEQIQKVLGEGDVAEAIGLWGDGVGRGEVEVFNFGSALFGLYYFEEAEVVFDRLFEIGSEEYLLGVARMWFGVGRFEVSGRFSDRALELSGGRVDVVAMHASNLVRAGRVEEGERILLDALERGPGHVRCVRLLAHVERTSGRVDEARVRLEDCLRDYPSVDDWRLEYELGYIMDRLGDYSGAMRVMERAKSALRGEAGKVMPAWRARTARQWAASQLLDERRLAKWGSLEGGDDVVIVAGFPRSGTTLLENVLSTHERCVGTDETGILNTQFIEPIVFGAGSAVEAVEELDDFYEDELAAGRAEYYRCTEAVMGEARDGRILLEKEPLMTADLVLPLRLFPQCKILMPLRDPRDVVISFYYTIVPLAANSVGSISLEESCRYYAEVMRHWLLLRDRLPKERWMESRYEDLLADAEGQTRRLAEFLGIEWNAGMLEHYKRKGGKAVTTPTYADVGQALYTRSRERWRNYEEELAPYMYYLEPYIEAFGYGG